MKLLLILLGLLAISSVFLVQYQTEDEYDAYKRQFNKFYANSSVDDYRRAIYFENKAKIEAWNAQSNKSYEQGINQFTDLTAEEFESTFLGLLPEQDNDYVDDRIMGGSDIDWSAKGEPFNKVKNQGSCGSCWAFSAVGSLEAINKIDLNKVNYFSEQQLVDCSTSYGNHGCNGGLMTNAFKYVIKHGLVPELEYPYTAKDGKCKVKEGRFFIKNYKEIKACKSQEEMIQKQPVAVAADASRWSSYKSGIFDNCGTSLNHGITLVGVNYSENYWKIKNSWGSAWGENGFIRLKLGNTCGVCNMSSYPIDPYWK